MTYEEFELEEAQIELAYDEKIIQFENDLREIANRNEDLAMQQSENNKEARRIEFLLEDVRIERKKELLNLYRARVSEQKSN